MAHVDLQGAAERAAGPRLHRLESEPTTLVVPIHYDMHHSLWHSQLLSGPAHALILRPSLDEQYSFAQANSANC